MVFGVSLINGDIYIYPRLTRCHGNEIWNKIGYNSASVRNFCKIFAHIGGFRKWAIICCQLHFSSTDPVAMATKFGPTAESVRPIFTFNTSNDTVPRKEVPF